MKLSRSPKFALLALSVVLMLAGCGSASEGNDPQGKPSSDAPAGTDDQLAQLEGDCPVSARQVSEALGKEYSVTTPSLLPNAVFDGPTARGCELGETDGLISIVVVVLDEQSSAPFRGTFETTCGVEKLQEAVDSAASCLAPDDDGVVRSIDAYVGDASGGVRISFLPGNSNDADLPDPEATMSGLVELVGLAADNIS